MNRGLVGNITRYALHDGPGIRTTVFFKGCPLCCPWCHNPELISHGPEIAFYREYCIECGDCQMVCPEGAVRHETQERIDRSRCTACGLCTRDCPTRALEQVGTDYGIEELVEVLLRDRFYYESSGGGVTLSGGEPTSQMLFIGPVLQRLQGEGIHTTLETNGYFAWDTFVAGCLEHLDLILFDVKIADPDEHEKVIGVNNQLILANLAKLAALRPKDVIARIPLIPGYTATKRNVGRIAELFRESGVRRYSLLPFHPYGLAKAARVGREPGRGLPGKAMAQAEAGQWRRFFTSFERVDP